MWRCEYLRVHRRLTELGHHFWLSWSAGPKHVSEGIIDINTSACIRQSFRMFAWFFCEKISRKHILCIKMNYNGWSRKLLLYRCVAHPGKRTRPRSFPNLVLYWFLTKAVLILRILKFGTENATCTVFLAKAFLYGRVDFISQRCISWVVTTPLDYCISFLY